MKSMSGCLKIEADGAIFGFAPWGGISRYFQNLSSNLAPWADFHFHIPTSLRKERLPALAGKLRRHRKGWLGDLQSRWPAPFLREGIRHPTYYYDWRKKPHLASKAPTVITVHDMIHEKIIGDFHGPWGSIIDCKRRAVEMADAVICISQNTRRDLLNIYPQAEHKVSVIHLGPEIAAKECEPLPLGLPQKFLLYVGARHLPYKGFKLLLAALSRLHQQGRSVPVVIAGKPPKLPEQELIGRHRMEKLVHWVFNPNDNVLANLYLNAEALAYPSQYEGFGLPVLEAMNLGLPVVAFRNSSIPEVAGAAAWHPESVTAEALAECLWECLTNSPKRAELIEEGRKRAALFSWEECSAKTLNLYRDLQG